MSDIELFISHSQKDEALAERLVQLVKECLEVPSGAIRCSSVQGYKLDLGALLSTTLQAELKSALHVVALLTPNSIDSPWVLFELGAVWGLARSPLPMLAGGLGDADLPGPLWNVVAGRLEEPGDLADLISRLHADMGWPERSRARGVTVMNALADYAKQLDFQVDHERRASFAARRAHIGNTQNDLLELVTTACRRHGSVTQAVIKQQFTKSSDVYYRLEQLRYLGFINKERANDASDGSRYRYVLTPEYKTDIGLP
jgi:hypothetical protein